MKNFFDSTESTDMLIVYAKAHGIIFHTDLMAVDKDIKADDFTVISRSEGPGRTRRHFFYC